MITYNDIYEAARKERYSEQLQGIAKNFVEEVADYIRDKKEIVQKEDDVFSDVVMKTKKQLENATTLFKELLLRRRKKILNLVLIASETGISKQDFENMMNFEKELFEDLMKNIEVSDNKINNKLNGEKELEKVNETILFREDVGEFVGAGGESRGPYEKGQIANLPSDIARILVNGGKAERIE